ncbi:MAG: BLUF domain-containing protein [Halioglobus sp.]
MANIRQVIYISRAAYGFSAAELHELAAISARKNQLQGITGALLFIDHCFIQIIEGEEHSMSDLLDKLEVDPRHHDMRIISDHLEDSRHFSDWSMGLVSTPDEEKKKVRSELRAVADITHSENAFNTSMPMPHTAAMMQHLYETDSILQQARR